MNYIPCAFIDSDRAPILSTKVEGLYVEEYTQVDRLGAPILVLYTFVVEAYPHPDAPTTARLSILRRQELGRLHSDNQGYASLYLLLQAQRAVTEAIIQTEKAYA